MTDSAVILELRHSRLADSAAMSPAPLSAEEQGVFVAIDDPPPVRTMVTVVEGDNRRILEVARVVEVAERDERKARGFYGRFIEGEAGQQAQARAAKVGTEHLEDGTPVVQPVRPDHSVSMDVSDAPAMGMAAPVLIVEEDTGVVDVDTPEDDAEAASGDEAQAADAADDSDVPDEVAAAEAPSDEAAPAEADADNAESTDAAEDVAAEGEASETEAAEEGSESASQSQTSGRRKGRKGRKKRRR